MDKLFVALLLVGVVASEFAEGSTLSGNVLDPAEKAVSGATVWLWQEAHVQKTATDEAGAFTFKDVALGPLQLVALKDGYSLGGAARFAVGDGEETLRLGVAGQIHLKVSAPPSGEAVPGARVYSMMVNDSFVVPVEELVGAGFPQGRSGDDGQLTLDYMPADGFIKLNLKHLDYADTYVDFVPVRERVTPVLLERGEALRGRVTDGKAATPNARVTVYQLGTSGQREFARATTDPDGLFQVRLAPGDYFVAARHPAFASPAPIALHVEKDKEAKLPDLALLEPYRLKGQVVLPDGAPCPGVRITYRKGDTIFDETFTGADGTYAVKAASPDGTLRVAAPPGYKTEVLPDIKVSLGERHEATVNTVRLQALPVIEGTVTLEDGSPGAQVLIASLNVPQALWMITDAEGKFRFQLGQDPDAESIRFLAEHAERFQRAEFTYALKDAKPAAVKLASYNPDEQQPDVAPGTNNLSEMLDGKAPEFKCSKWFNGEALTREGLKGQVAVLLFWAGFDTTVEGINKVEQMRALAALYKDIAGVRFVGLHDCTSEAAEVEGFIKRAGIEFPVGLDAEPTVTFGAFHVTFIPELVMLDKSGNIRYFQPGPRIVEFIKILKRRAK